ncbi:hypothetical protein OUZ56_005166 [Daphnia magna]|uniref:Uncharacterized protein n=1 Tax=Daphnia magna TaxID=35525 RepID=A0ABQ9YS41_9CRUS|nr:hypothetical protein OUZ56_005166 [Daphnia magna]
MATRNFELEVQARKGAGRGYANIFPMSLGRCCSRMVMSQSLKTLLLKLRRPCIHYLPDVEFKVVGVVAVLVIGVGRTNSQ